MTISDKQLQQQIDAMPKEIAPDRDLWQGIEKAINQQPSQVKNKKQKFMLVANAASLAALLVIWLVQKPAQHPAQQADLIAALSQGFAQQKQLMLTSFGEPDLTTLPAEMQVELAKLAKARASIEAALANDENNTDLLNLLQWTQQQELDLIKRLYTPQWQTI